MTAVLILASASPRRRELLSSLPVAFTVIPAEIAETIHSNESPRDFACRVAQQKAHTVAEQRPGAWVLGADTVVTIDDAVLGKPEDAEQVQQMLRMLSGREHFVVTGYALTYLRRHIQVTRAETTAVRIKPLEDSEIAWYMKTGEPFDKAGGYAIQGKAAFMVESIVGSYTNVVGLPLCQVATLLHTYTPIRMFTD